MKYILTTILFTLFSILLLCPKNVAPTFHVQISKIHAIFCYHFVLFVPHILKFVHLFPQYMRFRFYGLAKYILAPWNRSISITPRKRGFALNLYWLYFVLPEFAFKVVIRNLHHLVDPTDINTRLQAEGYDIRKVVHNIKYWKTKIPLPLFFNF